MEILDAKIEIVDELVDQFQSTRNLKEGEKLETTGNQIIKIILKLSE